MVCKRFWSCLCCCLSSVLCGAPGACAQEGTWEQPGGSMAVCCSWSSRGQDVPGLICRVGAEIPPGAVLGSLQCAGGAVLSPCGAVLSPASWGSEVCLGDISHREALSFHRDRLWTPGCGSLLTSPVHGSCLHWEWDQPTPLSPRVMCVLCLCVRKVLENHEQLGSSCGSESGVVWHKNLSVGPQTEHLSKQYDNGEGCLEIFWLLKPPYWDFAVGLRPNPERWLKKIFCPLLGVRQEHVLRPPLGDSLGPWISVFREAVGSGRLSKLHRVHWRLRRRGRTVLPVDSTTRKAGAVTASRDV